MSTPAERVIRKFGGQSALARLLGKGPSTVFHWKSTGAIPAKWHGLLLELATEHNVDLLPEDLVLPDQTPPAVRAKLPVARWPGELEIGSETLPVFVLDNGERVISRVGATEYLTGLKKQGTLERYIFVENLKPYLPEDFAEQMVAFTLPEVKSNEVRGLTAESFLEICTAYVRANAEGALSDRQAEIAKQAAMFLTACSKIGLIALIDEATGYQYARAEDALQTKLKLFLEEEMRPWEKTFPDRLWEEFGRLTNWEGPVHSRPKYWGHLVNELVYGYLDRDVAEWLREHAPAPRHGENYHQWMSSQYGLKKLIEHIWMLIGIASTCQTMGQLRRAMADRYGHQGVLFVAYLDPAERVSFPRPSYSQNRRSEGVRSAQFEIDIP